jgi:osmotically-inducible protein OsmY
MQYASFQKLGVCALLLTSLTGCGALVVGTAATTGAVMAQDRRTTGSVVEDSSIEYKAKSIVDALTPTHQREKVHVNIISYNGNVLLLGQVPNEAFVDKIIPEIKQIPKVNKIINELTYEPVINLMARTSDSMLTAKVKTAMMRQADKINATRVKVVTEDSVVYLMGIINKNEEEIAVDIARQVKGVKKVVKIFEYIPR